MGGQRWCGVVMYGVGAGKRDGCLDVWMDGWMHEKDSITQKHTQIDAFLLIQYLQEEGHFVTGWLYTTCVPLSAWHSSAACCRLVV